MARLDQEPRRTVRRAQDFYAPPPDLRPDAWDLMPPAERVIAYMERKDQRRLPRPGEMLPGEVLIARIDAARWVAQCPHCSSAQVVSPDDPRMWCVECLPDGWARVRFPADTAAVEATVELLSARERFWWADDDTAWNRRPRPPEPLTPKQERAAAQRDVDNLPGSEPPADEPTPRRG